MMTFKKSILLFGVASIVTTNIGYAQQKSIENYGGAKSIQKGKSIAAIVPTYGKDVPNPNLFGTVTKVAGNTGVPGNEDGASAKFNLPLDIAFDSKQNIYIADARMNKIRVIKFSAKTNSYGETQTLSASPFIGINGIHILPASTAYPKDILYTAERGNGQVSLFAIDNNNGTITLKLLGQHKDGISSANDVVADPSNPFVAFAVDRGAKDLQAKIIKVTFKPKFNNQKEITNIQSDVEDAVTKYKTADNKIITPAFDKLNQLKIDANGNIYFTDRSTSTIIKATKNGNSFNAEVIAGKQGRPAADNQNTNSQLLLDPIDIELSPNGEIYASEFFGGLLKFIDSKNNAYPIVTLAGNNSANGYGVGYKNKFAGLFGLKLGKDGNLYFAQRNNHDVCKINVAAGKFPYTISPALPEGLIFNHYTGEITGAAINNVTEKTYTITTYNNAGKAAKTATITLKVSDAEGNVLLISGVSKNTSTNVTNSLPADGLNLKKGNQLSIPINKSGNLSYANVRIYNTNGEQIANENIDIKNNAVAVSTTALLSAGTYYISLNKENYKILSIN